MIYLYLLGIFLLFSCASQGPEDYPIKPVPFTDVAIEDGFWLPRMETNRNVTIPYAFRMCEETGRIDNFAIAGGLIDGLYKGYIFNDSDVFKVIEGAAYSLAQFPDPQLEVYVDGVIDKIAAAQEKDGYLYTARTAMRPDKMPLGGKERWSHIEHGHELYNAGHLYEAAVAYFQATGKKKLLEVSEKNVALIDDVFGPGKKRYPPGHEEIEIALGKLYRLTGKQKYLDLAKYFLDERGNPDGHKLYGEYNQDHIPVIEQEKAVGHAVRAAYLYSGMADIAALTGDQSYVGAIGKIWEDVVGTKLYITGGIGATGGNEGFSFDYALPNDTAYSETCASIANAMWNHRMFLLHGEGKYMDVVERVIYNAFLSGVGMEGDRFFYSNRLAAKDGEERSPWFACACCPSNIVRYIPSIPGYIYAHRDNEVFVNLYIGSRARFDVGGETLNIMQKTDYPWSGVIHIVVEPQKEPKKIAINFRIPGWAADRPVPGDLYRYLEKKEKAVTIFVNDKPVDYDLKDGFAKILRVWKKGDSVQLNLPMPVRRILAHDNIEADRDRVALQRGPLVYCAEWVDNRDGNVGNILLADDLELTSEFRPDLLNGVQVILGKADPDLVMIPYYAWAHRGKGEMAVWLPRERSANEKK